MHTDDIFDDKDNSSDRVKTWPRREFVTTVAKVVGGASLLSVPGLSMGMNKTPRSSSLTVQDVINLILSSIPGAPFPKTVDTIKSGNPSQKVTGIITTMFATNKVIEQTISAGANFIIAHEPTFYNHLDDVTWLAGDEVYQNKKNLLEKNKIVVWRFHDSIHAHKPDGVLMGVLQAVGWQQYYNADKPHIIILPAITLGDIINHLKDRLGIQHLKVIGDLSQKCSRIALLPGASGGMSQIGILQKEKPDVLICGEINEWETAEYVRDLRQMGTQISLIITGHAVSEEPGLEWLVTWLQPQIPGIKITHIPSYDPFEWA